MYEEYRYLCLHSGIAAYKDFASDEAAIAYFKEQFPDWESVSVWDDDFKFWIDVAER